MRVAARFIVAVVLATAAALPVGMRSVHAANDPGWPLQWNMSLVGAEAAWRTGVGHGTVVAVVDSGVDPDHEDVAGRVLPGRNFVAPGQSTRDDHGHGTHVAGIAAAAADNGRGVVGIAPSARILPVKVFDAEGKTTDDAIYDGIRWAADNGAHVINLSLSVSLRPLEGTSVPVSDAELSAAVRYAWEKGVICVLASGNDGSVASAFSDESGVVVTATDKGDRLASYANPVGAAKWGMAAPGGAGGEPDEDDVLSTFWFEPDPNQYAWGAGTSMAAPHVAGAAALLRGLGLTPQQTVDRLLATARDLGAQGEDETYGHGRVDVAKAVEGLTPAATTLSPTSSTTTTVASTSTSAAGAGRTTALGGPRQPQSPTTAPAGEANSTATTDVSVPNEADDRRAAALEELEPLQPGRSRPDDVWPLGLVATAALVAVAGATARARRRLV